MSPQAIMEMVWPALGVPVIVPFIQWVKGKIPKDLPFVTFILAVGLSSLFVWGVDWFFELGLTKIELTTRVLECNVVNQMIHGGWKTLTKHTNLGG